MIVVDTCSYACTASVGSGRRTDQGGGCHGEEGARDEERTRIGFAVAPRATREAARIALERGWLPHSQN